MGFDAPENIDQYMTQILDEIQNLCPSESYIDATAEKELDHFTVCFSVNHSDGRFSVDSTGIDLKNTVTQATKAIKEQIRHWQRQRFNPN